jgi:DNA-binding NtrC family response regulator
MKKKKILVIDDEEDFGFLMKSFFTPKNFDVYIALTLGDGMRILNEEKPDVIFLDNNLPDGLGWGQTEYILVNYPLVQLNLISALNVPKTSASSFRILEKPLHWELLKEMVDNDFTPEKNIN